MTLPASGTLSMSTIDVELGQAATYPGSMSWVYSNTKTGQQSYAFNGLYSKAWYQRNVDGNCNNGNCNCNGNCGNIQCRNCVAGSAINCANCDARSWLQSNCNCACTYNCNAQSTSYNCDCNCDCNCGGRC